MQDQGPLEALAQAVVLRLGRHNAFVTDEVVATNQVYELRERPLLRCLLSPFENGGVLTAFLGALCLLLFAGGWLTAGQTDMHAGRPRGDLHTGRAEVATHLPQLVLDLVDRLARGDHRRTEERQQPAAAAVAVALPTTGARIGHDTSHLHEDLRPAVIAATRQPSEEPCSRCAAVSGTYSSGRSTRLSTASEVADPLSRRP